MNQPKRLAIKLHPKAETILKKGHPWIFSDSIVKLPENAVSGDVAVIFSQKDNKLIGIGLYDVESPIKIKILSANKPVSIDELFFKTTFSQAFNNRTIHFNDATNAYRLIYGESDGMPGLIVDVYDKVAVLKLYSSIWLPYLEWIKSAIISTINPQTIVLRLSRNVQKINTKFEDGSVLFGNLNSPVITFKEHAVLFNANVIEGHKTGYFLDHRANRYKVGQLSKGKRVLDVFAYAGGFTIHALMGGAKEVTSVDISSQALAVAQENAALNTFKGKHFIEKGDAFEVLKRMVNEGLQFDIVVIDPPSFAKQQSEVTRAIKQYEKLANLGAQLCVSNGILVLASCSSRVTFDEFKQSHSRSFSKAKIKSKVIASTQHDWDHPITIPETAYLKTIYYQIL